jgi:hypothetical protein
MLIIFYFSNMLYNLMEIKGHFVLCLMNVHISILARKRAFAVEYGPRACNQAVMSLMIKFEALSGNNLLSQTIGQ